MIFSVSLLILASFFYLMAMVGHVLSFADLRERGHQEAVWMLKVGFLISSIYFVFEAYQRHSFLPVVSHDQVLVFLAWSLAFVYLVLLSQSRSDSFGLILMPILLALTVLAIPTRLFCKDLHSTLKPELMTVTFAVHIMSAFLAYACFGLSFAASILYYIQHRQLKTKQTGCFYHKLPSLENLDRLLTHAIGWGALLLAIAVGVGIYWSKAAFGHYWIFDLKTIVTVCWIFLYIRLFEGRLSSRRSARSTAFWAAACFLLVMISFIGLRFVPKSHDYLQASSSEVSSSSNPSIGRP